RPLGEIMAHPDPFELNILDVTTQAMMFRLNPADPTSPESITISRNIFDMLLAIAESAYQASNPHPFGNSLQATKTGEIFSVAIDGGQFGKFTGGGRTLLEAVIAAHHAYGSKLASYID
ncbi:MAG: hypothetical protein KIS72_09015, partial [Luteimonas sp.]|nr:hypothetical protein [Luteimonas sp.]